MSRTIRNKYLPLPRWVDDLYGVGNLKAKRMFYTDCKHFKSMTHAPAWYRRMLEKERRAKQKKMLRDLNKKGIYDEYLFDPIKKNAAYYYW